MEKIKLEQDNISKVSNLKFFILAVGMPIAMLPILFLVKLAPSTYFWVTTATKGLITHTLLNYLVMYFIFIYLILIKASHIEPIKLGLDKKKLSQGILTAAVLLILLQLFGAIYSYAAFGKLTLNEVMKNWTAVIGYYIELFAGVALFEEVVYRGFLIPQIFIRLKVKRSKASKIAITLALSQVIFAVVHLPVRIASGMSFGEAVITLVYVFFIGIVFAFTYLLTDNLYIAMAIHALWDASVNNLATMFSSQCSAVIIALFAFILMYIKAAGNKKKASSLKEKWGLGI
jgi:membrane protease YdiL (CAAX protease family)